MGKMRITCKKLSKLIRSYSDGELNISTEVAIEFHARHCDRCARELALQSAIIKGLRSGPSHRAPSGFASRALNRITQAQSGINRAPKLLNLPTMAAALVACAFFLVLGYQLLLSRNSQDEIVKRPLPLNRNLETSLTNVNENGVKDPLVVSDIKVNAKGNMSEESKNVSIGEGLTSPPSQLIVQEEQQLLTTVSNIPKTTKSFIPKAFDAKAFWNEGPIVGETKENLGNELATINLKREMSRELDLDESPENISSDPHVEFYRSITEDGVKDTEEEKLSKASILKKT